jgi:poly-gamma-glutamate synthesis protein (capsule biosynthesis protein)
LINAPDPDQFFVEVGEVLRAADITIGHVELPHTKRGQWSTVDKGAAAGADPANLESMQRAGFDIATFGSNHTFDQGQNGVEDTLTKLRELGMVTAGAGMNIDEARKPAIVTSKGKTIAVLQYNLVGLDAHWATPMKAGSAFLRVVTHYVNDISNPGGSPTSVYTMLDDWSVRALREDLEAVRDQADIVIVSYHMGRSGSDLIASYMKQASYLAIDGGADLVIGAHPHTISGLETYKGKTILYGLGHFLAVSNNFRENAPHSPLRNWDAFRDPTQSPAWPTNEPVWGEKKMAAHGGVKSPFYGYTDDTRDCLVARLRISGDEEKVDLLPCYIGEKSAPYFVSKGQKEDDIGDRINAINERNGLKERVRWSADGTVLEIHR